MDRDKFGNVSFGETTKLLVNVIGQDAILSVPPEKEHDSFKKNLGRIYNEDKIEFFNLATQEKENPQDYFKSFFKMLEEKYKVPEFVEILINDTIWQLFHACLSNTPFEKNKADTVNYLFRRQIFHLLNDLTTQYSDVLPKIRKGTLVPFLAKICDLSDTYKRVFMEAAETMASGNLSLLFRNINDFSPIPELSNLNLQTISRWDKGIKATWKSIKPILDFFTENEQLVIVHRLLAIYFIKNAKKAFSDLGLIENKEFDKIMIDLINMLIENRKPGDFYDATFGKEDSIEYHLLLERCLILTGQSNSDISSTEKLIDELEDKCPKSKRFFSPWLKAKIALSANNQGIVYNKIRDYYRAAFDEGKYYAGCFMWQFLLEAIALEKYQNKLSKNLNDYYAFGYAIEMFTGDKDILLETLISIKHFTLFEQYGIIGKFCLFLWQGPLLRIPYIPPQTELLFKEYLEIEMKQVNDLKNNAK